MKRNLLATFGAVVFTALLISGMTLGRLHQPQPVTAVVASPSPIDTTAPSPTPPIVVTLQSPLPSPVAVAPAPAPSPVPAPPAVSSPPPVVDSPSPVPSPTDQPSPTPTDPPSPVPSPSPTPPPPPPVCSWSVTVETLVSGGTYGTLGTWTGSAATASSPIFITGVYGYLRYTYQFSSACVGTATLLSYYVLSGATIFNTAIGGTAANTIEANVPNNTQVQLKVTLV